MWHNLYLLVSMLTSFLESTSVSIGIINQNINLFNDNEQSVETSLDVAELAFKLRDDNFKSKIQIPDFTKYTGRASEKKCMEYIYEMLKRQENNKNFADSEDVSIINNSNDVSIINGKIVKPAEYPHMGALGWFSHLERKIVYLCGSSLISDKFLITAAHCTYSARRDLAQREPFLVRLGSRYLENSPLEAPVDIRILRSMRYSYYKAPHPYFDIALVELYVRVAFTKFIQPACLASTSFPRKKKIIATGWGAVDAQRPAISRELRFARLTVFNNEKCEYLLRRYDYRHWRGMRPHQMCAGELDGNADTCQGDSGGPLQHLLINTTSEGSIHRIYAVTAFGLVDCAKENAPGVYTRIPHFINWIERNVWPQDYENFKRRNSL